MLLQFFHHLLSLFFLTNILVLPHKYLLLKMPLFLQTLLSYCYNPHLHISANLFLLNMFLFIIFGKYTLLFSDENLE